MEKVRYALIGFGGIAEHRIAKEGFAQNRERFPNPPDNFELVGAFDTNVSRRAAVESLGIVWYDSLEGILADKTLDAVFIATNNLSHAKIATAAIQAGKHVIVEKPLATTPGDAAALVHLAKSKKRSLAIDHMMVYNRLNITAKELVRGGKLGEVNDACFHMEFYYGSTPEEAATWRCAIPEECGGPIFDVASHCFYMAEFFFDAPITEVAAVYFPKRLGIAVEDGAYIRYATHTGLTGSVRVAFCEPRGGLGGTISNLGYEIYGSLATLRSYGTMFQLSGHPDEPVRIRLQLDTFDCQERIALDDGYIPNIYQSLIWHHAESILRDTPFTGEEGLHNVQLCTAAHQSAKSGGKPVAVIRPAKT